MNSREWDRARGREDLERHLHRQPLAKQFSWRLGRRGAFLATMGTLFLGLGWGYAGEVPQATLDQLAMPLAIIPDLRIWAAFWCVVGLVAIFNAWWPPGKDATGFIFLEGFSALWAVLNILGSLALGAPRAYVIGLIFGVYAISILIVSGMPDPTPIVRAQEAVDDSKER